MKQEQTGLILFSIFAQENVQPIVNKSEIASNHTFADNSLHVQSHLGRIERSYDFATADPEEEDEKVQLQLIQQELREQNNSKKRCIIRHNSLQTTRRQDKEIDGTNQTQPKFGKETEK